MTKVTPQVPALAGMTPMGFTPIAPQETPAMSHVRIVTDNTNAVRGSVWTVLAYRADWMQLTDPTGMGTVHVRLADTEYISNQTFSAEAAPLLAEWEASED